MKKIALFKKDGVNAKFVDRFDTVEEASDRVRDIVNEDEDANVFDFYTKEQEVNNICDRVKSYADACEVLGIEPMDEEALLAVGFRNDEIARRKLETITEALNEGWRPDWNNAGQWKYYPWFRIKPNHYGASAGLAYAHSSNAASYTYAYLCSRLCFHDDDTAAYAGKTFADLYAQILVENF